jgi:hypothetical protein
MAVHSAKIEVSGVRPATFKLKETAEDSFDLYHSSRKIGTARVEGRGAWSARFKGADREWKAKEKSPDELLALVGRFLLAQKARESETPPVQRSAPDTKIKSTPAERKLSQRWAELSLKSHLKKLDQIIAECRKRIAPSGKK